VKTKLTELASQMKIKNLGFVSHNEGCFMYNGTHINFVINSESKTTMWTDSKKDKDKNEKVLFTVRQNLQVEIFEFSELNILEAMKELCQTGKL